MCPNRRSAAFVLALFVLLTTSVHAQWVMAAHAARNQINRMTQRTASGGFDVATVVLDADPSKVYDKTIELLKTHPEVTITKEDKQTGTIQIQKGKQALGFQINALADKVTQMIVASGVGKSKETDQTSMVVQSIIKVCAQFNVTCTVQPN
jgi:hypothetical protein